MWYYIPINSDPKKGDKFQDTTDPEIIIEFDHKEQLPGSDPVYVFNTLDSKIRMTKSFFIARYKMWDDPWASQKKFAIQHGFTWHDEEMSDSGKESV